MTMDSYDKESLKKMISIIKGVFQRHTVTLKETLEGYGSDFSDKMLEIGLIVPTVKDDHQKMMKQYMAGLQPDSVDSIENHCRKFITILKNLGTEGGPILKEVLQLEQDIKKDVENKFVDLNFLGQSNSLRLTSLVQPDPYITVGLEVHRDSSIGTVKLDPHNQMVTGSTHAQSVDSGITSNTNTMTTNFKTSHQTEGSRPVQTAFDRADGLLVNTAYNGQINVNHSNSNLQLHGVIVNLLERVIKREEERTKEEMTERREARNRERTALEEQTEKRIKTIEEQTEKRIRTIEEQNEKLIEYLKEENKKLQERVFEREEITKKQIDLEEREKRLKEERKLVEERERQLDEQERKRLEKDINNWKKESERDRRLKERERKLKEEINLVEEREIQLDEQERKGVEKDIDDWMKERDKKERKREKGSVKRKGVRKRKNYTTTKE